MLRTDDIKIIKTAKKKQMRFLASLDIRFAKIEMIKK